MATLEDKILGEKQHNYCSSSEESGDENSDDDSETKPTKTPQEPPAELPEPNKWEGTSTNTGPKGVIKDWQRFKQLETEKRTDDERERQELFKKLSMTVRSALDEERDAANLEDPDLAELLNDEFLLEYQKQRMQEMLQQNDHSKSFGKLIHLTSASEYLDSIDQEDRKVKIIVHIYEDRVAACKAMNAALADLSKVYDKVKFCSIEVSRAGMSRDFKINGVPALLIYKGGQMIGNFVRLSDDLGNEFDAEDVQAYLIEHGMLEDKSLKPLIVRNADVAEDSD